MKEGNILFNNAFNTFHLKLYGIRYMVKDHSVRKTAWVLFPVSSKGSFIRTIP